ncbi:MAG: aspartate dehydrogenase [Candidatus Hydrogenedentes bacterium]|nr:aspartate dehydrogenase [Candidatus Hydrogenedentota bacterium]
MNTMKVGIVGCGNIATDLCLAVQKGDIPARIAALSDIDTARAEALRDAHAPEAVVCDLDANAASVDFIVECAAADAVETVVDAAIRHRKDCLLLSVGGLLACPELVARAREHHVNVRVPAGALCGLDGIRAAREGGLESVTLTTRKPPRGLEGAPYLVERGIDLSGIEEPKVVFEGSPLDACKAFPKNINVAAALSHFGIGPHKTRVCVIADPAAQTNSHEVRAEGAFGVLTARTENLPSPRNPKSSYLASLSAVAELRVAAESFEASQKE